MDMSNLTLITLAWELYARDQRVAQVYTFYDSVVAVIDACGIPDSVLDQAGNHPDVVDALNRQIETQQVVVSLQAELRTIDVDNPGEEGYTLLFSFLHAYNEYFRATRELG